MPEEAQFELLTDFEEEGANAVHLSGWLEIFEARQVEIKGKPETSLTAILHLRNPDHYPEDRKRYPVLLSGRQAEIMVDWGQRHPDLRPKVALSGRLFNMDEQVYVVVKHIQVLNTLTTDRQRSR